MNAMRRFSPLGRGWERIVLRRTDASSSSHSRASTTDSSHSRASTTEAAIPHAIHAQSFQESIARAARLDVSRRPLLSAVRVDA